MRNAYKNVKHTHFILNGRLCKNGVWSVHLLQTYLGFINNATIIIII